MQGNNNHYLGRQPILDSDGNIFAYDLLYADGSKVSSSDRYSTAAVISSVLNTFGVEPILGGYPAFVRVDRKMLLHDLIFSIPKEFFVLSLLHDVEVDERLVERIYQLHQRGYMLAINDCPINDLDALMRYMPILGYMKYFKVDVHGSDEMLMEQSVELLRPYEVELIATKVEEPEEHAFYNKVGYCYFQGYYFARPNVFETDGYDPEHQEVIRLYNMLMSDVNIDEIATAFENNHAITMKLLRYINSGAFHFSRRIGSIHHVLTLMGRIPVSHWLMLIVYAKSVKNGSGQSPLLLLAKSRTELMMRLTKLVRPDARSNLLGEAYFVGVLSLGDALFSVPLERLLNDLNIADEVKEALLHEKGLLGEVLGMVKAIEGFEIEAFEMFSAKHRIAKNGMQAALIETMQDVNEFEKQMQASGDDV